MQNLCFPEGLYYDGKNDAFRTHNINLLLDLTKKLSNHYEGNKKKKLTDISELSYSVEREGFEPPEPRSSTVFKTAAFDRSAISLCNHR